MPGVTVHPASSALPALDARFSAYANMSVADIKNKAKETVLREATKASAASLLRVARDQILKAKDLESAGDHAAALEGYIKTATLLKIAIDSPDYKREGARGSLRKEMSDFIQVRCPLFSPTYSQLCF